MKEQFLHPNGKFEEMKEQFLHPYGK
jgi:hypothetical protein